YIVLDESSHHLVWIVDAYVTSDRFPHAFQQQDGTNYQRNAVKATVDARTCRTTLYSVDPQEPITAAYSEIFPGLLTPLDKMPMSLKRHLRYPEDLLQAQAATYAEVHVRDPSVLFTRSDVWRVADETINDSTQPTQAYYVELTLPGDSKPSFVLLQTFSPARLASGGGTANNMTAWLAAQSDYTTTNHPKLVAVPLNNQNNVLGPLQFDNNLNSDPVVSQTKTLLGQGGSSVRFGNVIVLPFNNHSFLYVRPLYVLASSGGGTGAFPLLRYVLVGTQNNVALGTSLSDALQKLFNTQQPIPGLDAAAAGVGVPPPAPPGPGNQPSPTPGPGGAGIPPAARAVIDDLLTHQAAAQAALSTGDFAAYGREEAAIKADADKLRVLLGSSPVASATPAATPSPSASP
ncbi:MAG: UPF0182 family protein, partial [Candidatus Dormibacteraeota bacterium]|nr:UPF0182 family protein [Candidatus Dormibacteraeota bacterium]